MVVETWKLFMGKNKITKEVLEDLYITQELSTRDIAKKLNIGQTTVRRSMAKFNIKARTDKESRKTSVYKNKLEGFAERYREEYKQDHKKFCEYCGKEFHVDGRHKKKKYCSEECVKKSMAIYETRINENGEKEYKNTYTCEVCKKDFEFWSTSYYKRKVCDDCLSQHKSNVFTKKIKTKCGYCGKDIEVIPSRHKAHKYCYCDAACMAKHYADIYTGENSPTWKGGVNKHYKGKWLYQAKLCRERDGNTCKICGKTKDQNNNCNMDVHHIKKYRLFNDPIEANNLDNLISLCHTCHSFVHSNSNIDKLYIQE
jgi:transposase